MEKEKVKKMQKQFKNTYLDTVQHAKNIEEWIESVNRKTKDIKKSIQRLDSKFQKLLKIKTALINQDSNEDLLNKNSKTNKYRNFNRLENELEFNKLEDQLAQETKMSMNQIKNKIEKFSESVGLKKTDDKENKPGTNKPVNKEGSSGLTEENSDFFSEKMKGFNIKELIRNKYNYIRYRLAYRKKENKKGKKVGRIAAFLMAGTLAMLGSTTVGESNTINNDNNKKTYIDTNKGKNDFKKSLYVQALEKTTILSTEQATAISSTEQENQSTSIQPTTEGIQSKIESDTNKSQSSMIVEKTLNQQDNKDIEYKESADDVYILEANEWYTENSLGEGASGYVSKDTRVKIYNSAVIEIDENGNKKILKVTKPGKTLVEEGFDEKSIKDNPNIQKMVSLESEDGKTSYGWIAKDKLEKVKEVKEIER